MIDYPQLLELMRARRSVRRFQDRPVDRDDLLRLIEAARWAPSNHNRQPWRFLVCENRARIGALADAVGRSLSEKVRTLPPVAAAHSGEILHYATLFGSAPAVIVVQHRQPVSLAAALLADVPNPLLTSGEPLSTAMAVQNVLLAAQTLGLGACVLTGPLLAPAPLAAALTVPAGFDLTCLVAIGYPAEEPAAPRRKSVEQIAEFDTDRDQAMRPSPGELS